MISRTFTCSLLLTAVSWLGIVPSAFTDNQTATVSPIHSEHTLPLRVAIKTAEFSLAGGLHSYVFGVHDGKWLLLAGRTNGMHSFNNDPNNFPPSQQNRDVYVVDPAKGTVKKRSLTSHRSGLSQHEVDLLSVTSPQFYQEGSTLYITGGYGVNSATGQFSTKDSLTAIDVPGLMRWVCRSTHRRASHFIRHISDPIFKITGGYMTKIGKHSPTQLIFGQNFQGFYFDPGTNGIYSDQVRRFHILDDGKKLAVKKLTPLPTHPDENFRRRDLNILPVMRYKEGKLIAESVAFSGVFTLTDGAWTVPVEINAHGKSSMADPSLSSTFKQGMNNYTCATVGLFSKKERDMYNIFFGGISYGFFVDGVFQTDSELPFINQVTTIKIDKHGHFKQYLMKEEYPVILSTNSNPGNRLLFGAGSAFILADDLPIYPNGVIKWDKLFSKCHSKRCIGYIVGGIQSTVPNTSVPSDSAASPYIFKVYAIKK